MKRLLLVSYVFPPEPSPGALRPGYLARYLPQCGWDVTVLTHSSGKAAFDADVVRMDHSLPALARLPYRVQNALLVPDVTVPWVPAAIRAGMELLRSQRYDAIFATALPASVLLVASELSRRTGVPWIADYRDQWYQNIYARRGRLRSALERVLEKRVLRTASALTSISDPISSHLAELHRRDDVATIPNAYDPADWDAIDAHPARRFDLVFTGSMYDGRRSPDLLFAAIAQLRDERDPIARAVRVHFYGRNSDNVAASAARYGITLSVRHHGVVDRADALAAQRSAAALLIFLPMESASVSEMGSKFLEYVGSRRPIVAFGLRESVMRGFIAKHRLGWFASDVDEAKAALRAAYAHFEAGSPDNDIDSRSFPTAPELAQRVARVLNRVAGESADLIMEAS